MLSKQKLTFIRSLHQKKFRQMYAKFLVEGDKLVRELIHSRFEIDAIYALDGYVIDTGQREIPVITVSEKELKAISTHENPNLAVAIASIPENMFDVKTALEEGLYLVCDHLNDPGNAGSIIRLADWFGLKAVFFSDGSVDIYNPKVVNAAKGSLFRVACHSVNIAELLKANSHLAAYATCMNGENLYKKSLDKTGFIIIGNEANGVTQDIIELAGRQISIPSFGNAESLNAALAAGIIVSEFVRQRTN